MPSKQRLKQTADGISLMAFFTLLWAIVAEIALQRRDHYMLGVFFLTVIIVLIIYYRRFNSAERKLPMPPEPRAGGLPAGKDTEEKTRNKGFIILVAAEALAILLIKNIFANTGLDVYFIPCFALIVGLHFFPLGKIFHRSFDYYMGSWTSLVAIAGIVLTYEQSWPVYHITAMVAGGCALATSLYGVMMILRGHRIVYDTSISIH
jgi:hypothetical protein